MEIVTYPHPALRHRSKPLRRVDQEVRNWIREMFGAMYANKGVGLAANQVDLPYRLFVVNPSGDPEIREEEYVFINPVVSQPKGSAEAEEGCLSLPGIYAQVRRPESVVIDAYTLSQEEVSMSLDGLFARVVQHELDHLDGVLFFDRLSPTAMADVKSGLEELEVEFNTLRARGEIPDDLAIAARLAELEEART